MKGFWKNLITVGAIAGAGYLGFKGYQRISDIIKLSKTLPEYLHDLLDEKPKIDINMRLNSMSVAVGLTSETYENIDFDLDKQIQRYIMDYYPSLGKLKISTHKYIRTSDSYQDENDCCSDSDCCSDNEDEVNDVFVEDESAEEREDK